MRKKPAHFFVISGEYLINSQQIVKTFFLLVLEAKPSTSSMLSRYSPTQPRPPRPPKKYKNVLNRIYKITYLKENCKTLHGGGQYLNNYNDSMVKYIQKFFLKIYKMICFLRYCLELTAILSL